MQLRIIPFMVSPDNTPSDQVRTSTQQDVIAQIQSESIKLIRNAAEETIDCQKPNVRFGDWSSTLESEISRCLW